MFLNGVIYSNEFIDDIYKIYNNKNNLDPIINSLENQKNLIYDKLIYHINSMSNLKEIYDFFSKESENFDNLYKNSLNPDSYEPLKNLNKMDSLAKIVELFKKFILKLIAFISAFIKQAIAKILYVKAKIQNGLYKNFKPEMLTSINGYIYGHLIRPDLKSIDSLLDEVYKINQDFAPIIELNSLEMEKRDNYNEMVERILLNTSFHRILEFKKSHNQNWSLAWKTESLKAIVRDRIYIFGASNSNIDYKILLFKAHGGSTMAKNRIPIKTLLNISKPGEKPPLIDILGPKFLEKINDQKKILDGYLKKLETNIKNQKDFFNRDDNTSYTSHQTYDFSYIEDKFNKSRFQDVNYTSYELILNVIQFLQQLNTVTFIELLKLRSYYAKAIRIGISGKDFKEETVEEHNGLKINTNKEITESIKEIIPTKLGTWTTERGFTVESLPNMYKIHGVITSENAKILFKMYNDLYIEVWYKSAASQKEFKEPDLNHKIKVIKKLKDFVGIPPDECGIEIFAGGGLSLNPILKSDLDTVVSNQQADMKTAMKNLKDIETYFNEKSKNDSKSNFIYVTLNMYKETTILNFDPIKDILFHTSHNKKLTHITTTDTVRGRVIFEKPRVYFGFNRPMTPDGISLLNSTFYTDPMLNIKNHIKNAIKHTSTRYLMAKADLQIYKLKNFDPSTMTLMMDEKRWNTGAVILVTKKQQDVELENITDLIFND